MKTSGVVFIVGLVLVGTVTGSARAQDPEFHYLQGGHIEDVTFIDSSRGWTVEDGGRIRWTDDGGQDWTIATTPSDSETWVQLNGIFVLDFGDDTYRVWAVGDDGVVLVSTDTLGQEFADANEDARITNKVGEGDPCVPVGQKAKLYDIFMSDPDNGWVVGEDGVLMRTADGGATWQDPPTPPDVTGCSPDPYDAYDIHFFADSDYAKGIVAAEFNIIFTTEDGGDTWTYSSVLSSPTLIECPDIENNLEFWSMDFADPDDPDSVMWISGGVSTAVGFVFKRTGEWNTDTWLQLRCYDFLDPNLIDGAGTCSLSTMYALSLLDASSSRVMIAGYGGQLYDWQPGTADFDPCECELGQPSECGTNAPSWVQQDTTPDLPVADPCDPKAAFFGSARLGNDSGIAVGDFGRITLYDDGASNETVELGSEHFIRLMDGKFFDSTHGIAVGQRNTIYATDDGGATWDLVDDFHVCGPSDFFNAVDFSDDGQYGVAVGNLGLLVYSNDYGSNWSRYIWPTSVTNDFMAVDFAPDSPTVFVVGSGGIVKWSANGGAFWRSGASPGSENLYGVSFASDDVGYVCGAAKKVWRTTTGAGSWASVTVNGGGSETLWDVEQWDSGSKAIAVGDNGRVFQKSGTTFEQIDDDTGFPSGITQPLLDVELLNDGDDLRIGGDGGVVLFRDGGTTGTWTRVRSQTSLSAVKLSFPTAGEGFLIGYSFFVAHYDE